jgi:hypothetical protein
MTVYLLHLDKPLPRGTSKRGTQLVAAHYVGHAEDLITRIDEHVSTTWEPLSEPRIREDGKKVRGVKHGHGATFMGVANFKEIPWRLARIWEGAHANPSWEKRIKSYHASNLLCPVCNPNALNLMTLESAQ